MAIENIIKNHLKKMETPSEPKKIEDPEDPEYYSHEHDLFKLNEKGNIITDVPTQIHNLIANEPCNMSLDCISLKEFTIKYGIHRILGLEKPEQVTYDYFDYKRNKAVVLGPDSPLYILQNMLITKGPHADPDDPYHNEVLYPELSMDDIDPEMDMRELAHCMRPNSDFYVFVQDSDSTIINLSIRKHPYQIGNTYRTVTMSAGNIFKKKKPKEQIEKEKKKIKSIHSKISKIPIEYVNLEKIPYEINDHAKKQLEIILKKKEIKIENIQKYLKSSLNSLKNDYFHRPDIFKTLIKYTSNRSNLNLYLPYFAVYHEIFKFDQITRQFRYSENIQGFYCNKNPFSETLSPKFKHLSEKMLELKNDLSDISEKLKEEPSEELNKKILVELEIKKEISDISAKLKKEPSEELSELNDIKSKEKKRIKNEIKKIKSEIKKIEDINQNLPNINSLLFLQTLTNWKIEYIFSVEEINKNLNSSFILSKSNLSTSYKKSFLETKKSVFQNIKRTAEKIFSSKPFSHSFGLVKGIYHITFISNDGSVKRFESADLKYLNKEIIKGNLSKLEEYVSESFYNEIKSFYEDDFFDVIQNISDFSSFISELKISAQKSKTSEKNIIASTDLDFKNIFSRFTDYGVKYAFFSQGSSEYSEDLEETFKFGKNFPQIYRSDGSSMDFSHIALNSDVIQLIKKEKSVKIKNKTKSKKKTAKKKIKEETKSEIMIDLSGFKSQYNTKTFFTQLTHYLKEQRDELKIFDIKSLENIVSEQNHKDHILNIINLCINTISDNPLKKQTLPVQYIHFSQGFKLLKSIVELVDNYKTSCERCTSTIAKLNKSKKILIKYYQKNQNHWNFFKNFSRLGTKIYLKTHKKFSNENCSNEEYYDNFSRSQPMFSCQSYIMKARELWFEDQIPKIKTAISIFLSNPKIDSSKIIGSLKEIIQKINRIKRRQPIFESNVKTKEDIKAPKEITLLKISSEINTIYNHIKEFIHRIENKDHVAKLEKIIGNTDNFGLYSSLYLDPTMIKNDPDSFLRIFTKLIRSERDISKILSKINDLKKKKYPLVNIEKIYRWKQNFNISLKPKNPETEINDWTECIKDTKEIVFKNKDGIQFNWKTIWHDHRYLNYLCHHVVKLDSGKKYLSSGHIENSKELVKWLKSKKFTPAMIEYNWEKDNRTFLLTKKFLEERNYPISSLKDINKIKQTLFEEKKLYPEFSKIDLTFENIFEKLKKNVLKVRNKLKIPAALLDDYTDISKEMNTSKNKSVKTHYILHHLLQKSNSRKTNFEIFSKKIALENTKKLEKYESYSLQYKLPSIRSKKNPKIFQYCVVGHYNESPETDLETNKEKNKNILRQIYLLIFIPVKVPNTEIYNYYLLTSKFGLNTKNQFLRSENPSNLKNWRIFQEFKDLTDSLVEICPPSETSQNFWTSQFYTSGSENIKKNFTTCFYNDLSNNNIPPLNYTWLKFKQFYSSFKNKFEILDYIKEEISFIEKKITKNKKLKEEIKKIDKEIKDLKTEIKKIEKKNEEFVQKEKEIEEKKETLDKKKNDLGSGDLQSILRLHENFKGYGSKFSGIETVINEYKKNVLKKIKTMDQAKKFYLLRSFYLKGETSNLKQISSSFISLLYRKTKTTWARLLSVPLKSVMVSIKPEGKIILSVTCSIPFIRPTSYSSENSLGIDLGLREFLNYDFVESGTRIPEIKSFGRINCHLEERIQQSKKLSIASSRFQHKMDTNKSYFGIKNLNYKQKINLKEQNIANTSMRQSVEVIADFIKTKEIIGFSNSIVKVQNKYKKLQEEIKISSTEKKEKEMEELRKYIKEKNEYYNGKTNGLHIHLNNHTTCYIENLKGFQATKGSKFSEVAASWLRGNFRKFLEQKSYLDGFSVRTVPAPYTSKLCSVCGKEGLKGYLLTIPTTPYENADDKLEYVRKNHKLLFAPEEPKFSIDISVPAINASGFKKGDLKIWDYKRILNKMTNKKMLKNDIGQSLIFIFSQAGIVFYCPHCNKYSNRDINASVNIHTYNPIMYRVKLVNLWISRKTLFPMKWWKRMQTQFGFLFDRLSEALSYKVKNAKVYLINSEVIYSKENENLFLSFKNLTPKEFKLLINTLKESGNIIREKNPAYFNISRKKKLVSFKESVENLKGIVDKDDYELKIFKMIESEFLIEKNM